MNIIFGLLSLQALMGAIDNIWNHEIMERLSTRVTARREMVIHFFKKLKPGADLWHYRLGAVERPPGVGVRCHPVDGRDADHLGYADRA